MIVPHNPISRRVPDNKLIWDFAQRISSAICCAVGSTSVWCSAIRYCANFCNWSRLICSRVSAKNKTFIDPACMELFYVARGLNLTELNKILSFSSKNMYNLCFERMDKRYIPFQHLSF